MININKQTTVMEPNSLKLNQGWEKKACNLMFRQTCRQSDKVYKVTGLEKVNTRLPTRQVAGFFFKLFIYLFILIILS